MNNPDEFLYAMLTEIHEKLDDPKPITALDPSDSDAKKLGFERLTTVWQQVCRG